MPISLMVVAEDGHQYSRRVSIMTVITFYNNYSRVSSFGSLLRYSSAYFKHDHLMGYSRMLKRCCTKMTLGAYMLLCLAHSWFSVKSSGLVLEFTYSSGGFEWWVGGWEGMFFLFGAIT